MPAHNVVRNHDLQEQLLTICAFLHQVGARLQTARPAVELMHV
ncbi:hypothetical protein MPQ_0465 [Methylovorus sp. MP688]|nr:hypothetical protein MPQ_0465 [Methylovorus sp. MP688]